MRINTIFPWLLFIQTHSHFIIIANNVGFITWCTICIFISHINSCSFRITWVFFSDICIHFIIIVNSVWSIFCWIICIYIIDIKITISSLSDIAWVGWGRKILIILIRAAAWSNRKCSSIQVLMWWYVTVLCPGAGFWCGISLWMMHD